MASNCAQTRVMVCVYAYMRVPACVRVCFVCFVCVCRTGLGMHVLCGAGVSPCARACVPHKTCWAGVASRIHSVCWLLLFESLCICSIARAQPIIVAAVGSLATPVPLSRPSACHCAKVYLPPTGTQQGQANQSVDAGVDIRISDGGNGLHLDHSEITL